MEDYKRHLVFVYGTLRSGYGNNRLLRTSKKLGDYVTLPKFSMFSFGYFPYVTEGGKTSIVGEVWEVTNDVLHNLDALEGHPSFYERKQVIETDWGNAWIYLINNRDSSEQILSGDWTEYNVR